MVAVPYFKVENIKEVGIIEGVRLWFVENVKLRAMI